MEIEQLHQRLKDIERLVKDTKCVQANRDQLYQSDEQDQSCHHHLETQRIKKDFETTKREYDESSFSSQEQINQLDKRVKQLEFLQELYNRKPAFLARLRVDDTKSHLSSEVKVFDDMEANIGEVYFSVTGKFVAPKDGTYYFSVIISTEKFERQVLELITNGTPVSCGIFTSPTKTGVENGIIKTFQVLKKGDQVWVKHTFFESNGAYKNGTFLGFLL